MLPQSVRISLFIMISLQVSCARSYPKITDLVLLTSALQGSSSSEPSPGITVSPTSGLQTSETGTTDSFTVVLDAEPTADVDLGPITSLTPADGTVTPSDPLTITFTAANWNVAQTVTIMGVDDGATVDGGVSYSIDLGTSTSTDTRYSGLDPGDVQAVNTDNDCGNNLIFVTQATYTGAGVGGIGGADAKCNSDVLKPSTGTYRALIVDGVVRQGSLTANAGNGQIAWAFAPSTTYYRSDCTTAVVTTDGMSIFIFGTMTAQLSPAGETFWTGLNTDWTGSLNNCTAWLVSIIVQGQYGQANQTGGAFLNSGSSGCGGTMRNLVCVEQ